MIVELKKEYRFEAAHHLPRVPPGHKCSRLHGHSYRVELHVRGKVDPQTGWLVDSPEECAAACIEILREPGEARQRALRGKEYVRRHFLTPRLLRDWLVLFNQLLGNDTSGAEVAVVSAVS